MIPDLSVDCNKDYARNIFVQDQLLLIHNCITGREHSLVRWGTSFSFFEKLQNTNVDQLHHCSSLITCSELRYKIVEA